jgi:uncharacterized protein (DUF58 family)
MKSWLHKWDKTSFALSTSVYLLLLGISALFVASYFIPILFDLASIALFCLFIAIAVDSILLYRQKKPLTVNRALPERFSNGDDNKVSLHFRNNYAFKIKLTVIDELPIQLQERNWKRHLLLYGESEQVLNYFIQPKERGAYEFGKINITVYGILQLARRRFVLGEAQTVKVYPSYIQMRRYQLMAVTNNVQQTGVRRMRKMGHSIEFEQIKEYVRGDDYRTINWKASARRGDLMANNFTDEKSQQIYCLINKGRTMKMPFEGMTLLDYAINASLVIANVALQKQDKAGLITFGQQLDTFLLADKKPTQISNILQALYKQQTTFMEPDMEKLFSAVRNRISHRSLLVFFTNYESFESMQRELPVLKRLAHYHLLLVVLFENTELKQLTESQPKTTEEIYIQTISEKFRYEKKLMVKELRAHGIIALLSTPQQLTINTLNKYLELKNRQGI